MLPSMLICQDYDLDGTWLPRCGNLVAFTADDEARNILRELYTKTQRFECCSEPPFRDRVHLESVNSIALV